MTDITLKTIAILGLGNFGTALAWNWLDADKPLATLVK